MHVDLEGPTDENGYFLTPQTLIISADVNFNGVIEESEKYVEQNITTWENHDNYSVVSFDVPDDGPWGGNGTSSDNLKINISFAGDTATDTLAIDNVAPLFAYHPELSVIETAPNSYEAKLTILVVDVGIQDKHKAIVRWGDGVVTESEFVQSDFCSIGKTVSVIRYISSNSVLLPLSINVEDDDRGAVQTTLSKPLDVVVNNDDDNQNSKQDLVDRGFSDDDVRSLSLSSYLSADMNNQHGTFGFSYDSSTILVWDSQDKQHLILPTDSDLLNNVDWPTDAMAYTGQTTVWVEGIAPGKASVSFSWTPFDYEPYQYHCINIVFGGSIGVRVWGIDLDIDSDNNDVIENSALEEKLEDNPYALGKLVLVNHTLPVASNIYTQITTRITPGLDLNSAIRIQFEFAESSAAGRIAVWTRDEDDLMRNGADLTEGGSRISSGTNYSLSELHYNQKDGTLRVLYIAGIQENLQIKQLAGAIGNKPNQFIKATLIVDPRSQLSDKVKYLVTRPNSFYYHLQTREEVQTGIAASRIYERQDSPDFCLELLNESQLRELGVTDPDRLRDLLESDPDSGFEAGLYRNYITQKYVLSFSGTEGEIADVLADLYQELGLYTTQYSKAATLGFYLSQISDLKEKLIASGHSLGGGLATAATLAGGIPAVTFNSAGLSNLTIAKMGLLFPDVLTNFYFASQLIDAYFIDWDLLSYAQDHLLSFSMVDPMISALGTRRKLDGPFDSEIVAPLSLCEHISVVWAQSSDPVSGIMAIVGIQPLIKCHFRASYLYGLLVRENAFGDIVEDLLGFNKGDLDRGRSP